MATISVASPRASRVLSAAPAAAQTPEKTRLPLRGLVAQSRPGGYLEVPRARLL